ncbi:MAG TPA: hypothetical protein VEU73_03220 [Gemmatimonadales bacterium]|nr:hypothetical protein [Gemmatimonadales bacterium]
MRPQVVAQLFLAALATLSAAQTPGPTRAARITYLTSASAYLDAGRDEGLREGARVSVWRGGVTIGVLKVAYLASHRASCDIVSASPVLAVGDTVRFVPAAAPLDSSAVARTPRAPSPPGATGSGTVTSRAGLRGRLNVEYFLMRQVDVSGQLSQPALGLRLDGAPGGAPSLNLSVDVRARHSYTILADGSAVTDDRNRVYAADLSINAPGSPTRLTLGRQTSGALASVGVFDGVMAELVQPNWSTGVFAGTQPDPIDLAFSSSIVQGGVYAQRHSRPGAAARWALTLGASGSYQDVHANREFAWLQGSYFDARLSAFVTQEVDYYRPWKLLPGMHVISPTSTFAFLHVHPSDLITFDGGFDNRRNVLLYRDIVNPETNFDDTYRQGAWGGLSFQPSRRVRVGFDVRASSGGPAGSANSYTASFAADRLTRLGATLRTRTTYYVNPQLTGVLQSLTLGVDPGTRLHVELNGGVRSERDPTADPARTTATWEGLDADLTLARAWYLLVSATRQRGGLDGYDQIFTGLSFRF